ncbi:MAG: tetratricopeptide repeat protein [Gemmatimonadaceae bacterium]
MIGKDRHSLAWISVCGLAIAASMTSVANGFAFDDIHIILENRSVHSLARWWELFAGSYWPPERGGDLYRPFTMLGFAIQWAVGGGNPLVFHLGSILLYTITCAAFFWVVLTLLPLPAAWLAGSLFAVHPLHVEAVGNVVGQSELWAALFMFLALGLYLRARQQGTLRARAMCSIAALYVLACLSKEHGILLPMLLAAAELTVIQRSHSMRARLVEVRPLALLLAAVGLGFLWARTTVLTATSGPGAQVSLLFVDQPFSIRAMTMLGVVLEWVRLFLWPADLSADYSPRRIDIVTGPTLELLASAAIVTGTVWLAWLARRAVPVATFAALWVLVGLLIPSNILVPTEIVLAERTLFLASGGVMLGLAAALAHMAGEARIQSPLPRAAVVSIAVVLLLGVVTSALRQRVWRDNITLFAQTVRDAPTSYAAHLAYGSALFQQNHQQAAFDEIRIAYRLYPRDLTVVQYMGQIYARENNCPVALTFFRRALSEDPGRTDSRLSLASCLIVSGEHAEARRAIDQGLAIGRSKDALLQLKALNDSVEASRRTVAPR